MSLNPIFAFPDDMVLNMADNIIRKACDRCHSQKLSCKRVGDEACERCIRLQTECKSSPSLRYKKQQQQQQQQQQQPQHHHHHHHHQQQQQQHHHHHHHQHQYQQEQPPQPQAQQQAQQQAQHQQYPRQVQGHPNPNQQPPQAPQPQGPAAGIQPPVGRRSPKRRRTGSQLDLVVGEQDLPILQQPEDPGKEVVVAGETSLGPADLDFAQFEQLGFFSPPAPAPLPQGSLTVSVEAFQPITSFTEPWDHQLNQSNNDTFHPTRTTLPAAESNQFQTPVSSIDLRGGSIQGPSVIDKRRRSRFRSRPRQIALRHAAHAPIPKSNSPDNNNNNNNNIHWMAQLSEINSRLLDLASVLPQPQAAVCNIQVLGRAADEAYPDQGGFPIDEMFKLTRRVADVLDRLSACEQHGSGAASMDSSDPGNSMFVLSTYVRLLDMYQKVFSLVRMELSQADSETCFRFWRLPDVQVGSFAVDPSPSLQMSLTIQLAEEFLARLRAATAALDPALNYGHSHSATGLEDCVNGKSMFSDVVGISYRAVKSKEESLGKHLAELRDEIEAFLDH